MILQTCSKTVEAGENKKKKPLFFLREKIAHWLFAICTTVVNHRSSLTEKSILIFSPVFDL